MFWYQCEEIIIFVINILKMFKKEESDQTGVF